MFARTESLRGRIERFFNLFNSRKNENRNKESISLVIRNATKSIVLSSDLHYNQISDYIYNVHLNYKHSNFLIVPHHGGKEGKFVLKINKANPIEAKIYVGINKKKNPLNSKK